MSELGGFRRRLADQAKQVAHQASQAAQQASQAGLQHLEQRVADRAAPPGPRADDGDEGATDADVAAEVSRLQAVLAGRRPPLGPVRGRRSIGIGDLLAEHPRVPSAVRPLVRNLDRYGGLAITERTIEFDHDAIEWASVTEVRTRNVVEYLLSDALIQQIDTLPLPWFPGRRRVLEALSKALMTLVVAAARQQLDQHGDLRIPAEIEYRGAIRAGRQLSPGILAALVLADPAVNDCLVATARAHGITVRAADGDALGAADQRADRLRAKLGTLESRLGRGTGAAPAASSFSASAAAPSGPQPAAQPAYDLPDQGDAVVRIGHDVGGDWGASVIAAEVASVRRPDGALTFNDLHASPTFMKGPAYSLAGYLTGESIAVSAWAALYLGMIQRRTVSKQVEKLCLEQGLAAAVTWTFANVTNTDLPRLDMLRESLAAVPQNMPGGQALTRSEMAKRLRKLR